MKRVEGTVIAVHGGLLRVQVENQTLVVSARRRLDWLGKHPVGAHLAVGDRVLVERGRRHDVVAAVRERRTELLRRAAAARRPQVLAANVDQALVVFAAHQPEPSQPLLDRFLVACHLAAIEPVVTVNKIDLGTDALEPLLPVYRELGYETLLVSALDGRGIDQLRQRLAHRTTVFCGPSGSGKSSLLNAVHPGFQLRTGLISEVTGSGRHVTSRAELLPLPDGGFVVDTPGLRELNQWRLSERDLLDAFPEIASAAVACRFSDCSHTHEPDCAVLGAMERGDVHTERLRSYLSMVAELDG